MSFCVVCLIGMYRCGSYLIKPKLVIAQKIQYVSRQPYLNS